MRQKERYRQNDLCGHQGERLGIKSSFAVTRRIKLYQQFNCRQLEKAEGGAAG